MSHIEFIRGLRGLSQRHRGAVVTLGAFDGIHKGHQQLLAHVRQKSRELNLPSTVILFEPQPAEFFQAERAPARLMRLREKVAALQSLGLDRVLCLKFDQALRTFTAERFIQAVLCEGLQTAYLVVGDDFRFGSDRQGDFAMLQRAGQSQGFEVRDTRTEEHAEARISSTRIRALLATGEMEAAAQLLGRPYSLIGRVNYGKQLGRTLGFPTANLAMGRRSSPVSGVFAVEASLNDQQYLGVANVGIRPTINRVSKPQLEVHLFNCSGEFYGEFMQVDLLHKIREEQQFASVEQLQQQIQQDVKSAQHYFEVKGKSE